MVITPQTNIKLLKVPFEMDNLNQLTFSNATAQYNYFNGLTNKLEYDSCTYQRKDGYMAIYEDADTLQGYNYCMYQNEQYGEKWFYAFITNITYESNKVSYVYIKTDVFQTWQFDIIWKKSFIEREHTNDDTIGVNTVPEGLELGEYIVNASGKLTLYNSFYICFGITAFPNSALTGRNRYCTGKIYGGVYSGIEYIIVRDASAASDLLAAYNKEGMIDAIVVMFLLPTNMVSSITWHLDSSYTWSIEYGTITYQSLAATYLTTTKPTSLDSYTPINKKLLVYPYQYLNLDNNSGTVVTFHIEDFSGNVPSFTADSVITPGLSTKLSPDGYKKVELTNYAESFSAAKLPICSYQNEAYINWLKQNSLNIGLGIVTGTGQVIAGATMLSKPTTALAGAGNIASGLTGIATTLSESYKASLRPPQAEGNLNQDNVNFYLGLYNPKYYFMSIKREYAEIIDNFFSMYGYKTNRLKLPNITGRANWNYVKTIGCNITGDIPQKDLQEIKNMFDNGVTLWHNASTFLDYSQSNTIVS